MHELERENTMQYEEKEASATRQEKLEQDSAEMIDETLLFMEKAVVCNLSDGYGRRAYLSVYGV